MRKLGALARSSVTTMQCYCDTFSGLSGRIAPSAKDRAGEASAAGVNTTGAEFAQSLQDDDIQDTS